MKLKLLFTLLVIVCSSFSWAQDTQHCYSVGVSSVDSEFNRHSNTTVCEFSSGRVNVTTTGEDYNSTWYTAKQWYEAVPTLRAAWDKQEAAAEASIDAHIKFMQEQPAREEAARKAAEEDAAARLRILEAQDAKQKSDWQAFLAANIQNDPKHICEANGGNWSNLRTHKCKGGKK
jgi:hypothetical protein